MIDNETGDIAEIVSAKSSGSPSLLKRVSKFFSNIPDGELLTPSEEPAILSSNVRIARKSGPFMLTLGNVALEVHPDLPVTGEESNTAQEWIIHTGAAFYESVPMFLRIGTNETVLLGRVDDLQTRIFSFDNSVANRHVKIFNRKGELTIQPLELELPTRISSINTSTDVWAVRQKNLLRLPEILGHALAQFDDEHALGIARNVNELLASEAYREPNDKGMPGGIINLPNEMTVVIMGDIHARVENLLCVITEGGLLTALERGEACLVFLGDLIHGQESGGLENMESSVFILDLFFMLKRRFPKNVFYIRGNHESFSPNVGKGGVPQGLLFRKHLEKLRGKEYAAEIEKLFNGLAFIIQGEGFAACHGAPARSKVNRETLINIQRYPGIQSELVWNRLRQGIRPAGYVKGSVKKFRKTLNLAKHAPLIVAHTPLSLEDTLWLNVGDIKGHHIVYSAHTHRVAALAMKNGQVTPLEFIPELALKFLANQHKAQ